MEQVLVAPSLETFDRCPDRFKHLATGRGSPVELEQNPPEDNEIRTYLLDVLRICGKDRECVEFWATPKLELMITSGECNWNESWRWGS
jgi:hypothetical protein